MYVKCVRVRLTRRPCPAGRPLVAEPAEVALDLLDGGRLHGLRADGGALAQARAGEGRRADDEARGRGVVPRKKRLRGGVAEVEALRGVVSPGTRQRYTVTLLCEALHAPRSNQIEQTIKVRSSRSRS